MLSDVSQAEKDNDHGFTHMWNISNGTEDHRGREGNLKGEKSEREMNHERLDAGKQTEGFRGEEVGENG